MKEYIQDVESSTITCVFCNLNSCQAALNFILMLVR